MSIVNRHLRIIRLRKVWISLNAWDAQEHAFSSRLLLLIPVILDLPMSFLMARSAEGNQILGRVIAEAASRLNMMDMKIFHPSARLATPAVSLQNFTADLTVGDENCAGCAAMEGERYPRWHREYRGVTCLGLIHAEKFEDPAKTFYMCDGCNAKCYSFSHV
jgi:hypothetical protein